MATASKSAKRSAAKADDRKASADSGKKKKAAKAPADSTPQSQIAQLAVFLGSVGTLEDRIKEMVGFSEFGIAIPDWLLLRSLQVSGPMSMAEAATHAGVTRQRVHQQVKSLDSYLTVSPALAGGKGRLMALSPEGKSLIARLEAAFLAGLAAGGELPAKQLRMASHGTHRLLKTLNRRRRGAAQKEAAPPA